MIVCVVRGPIPNSSLRTQTGQNTAPVAPHSVFPAPVFVLAHFKRVTDTEIQSMEMPGLDSPLGWDVLSILSYSL